MKQEKNEKQIEKNEKILPWAGLSLWLEDSHKFNNRGAIADQPRTNRRFHRHFLKIEFIWVVRL
jgi:hypothetical protein